MHQNKLHYHKSKAKSEYIAYDGRTVVARLNRVYYNPQAQYGWSVTDLMSSDGRFDMTGLYTYNQTKEYVKSVMIDRSKESRDYEYIRKLV